MSPTSAVVWADEDYAVTAAGAPSSDFVNVVDDFFDKLALSFGAGSKPLGCRQIVIYDLINELLLAVITWL
jgi:hypothetical protein